LKLHHIGIVVSNISESFPEITQFIKFDETTIPSFITSQKVNVCFLKMGDIRIELIEPIGNDSPVANFAHEGGGFHHFCFEVEDIRKQISEFVNQGAKLIVEPVIGFEGRLTAFVFLNMKYINTNLIELVEIQPSKS